MSSLGQIVENLSDIQFCSINYQIDGVSKEVILAPKMTVIIDDKAVIKSFDNDDGSPGTISIAHFPERKDMT